MDTIVCLTLAKWETVSGHFRGYLTMNMEMLGCAFARIHHQMMASIPATLKVNR